MDKRFKSIVLSAIIIAGLLVINLIIQVGVDPSYNTMTTDSGTFAYCGQIIRNGGLMYRDCWDNKPPAIYYLNAFAIWLAGANPFAIWLFQAIWLMIALIAFYLVMSRVWDSIGLAAVGAFILLFVVLYPAIFQGGNYTETYAILPAVLAIGVLWSYLQSGHKGWLVVLGLLFSAGFMLKPTYIAVELAAAVLVVYLGLRQRKFKALLLNLAIFGIAAILPIALVALFWLSKGDLYGLWFAVFAHNFTYLQEEFSLSSLYGTTRMFLVQQPMAALSILVMISAVAFLSLRGRMIFTTRRASREELDTLTPGRMSKTQARTWLLAAVYISIMLDVIFVASSGKNFGHYLQVVIPGMVVGVLSLFGFVAQIKQEVHLTRNLSLAILAAVVIVSLGGGIEIAGKELPNISALKSFITTPSVRDYQPTELEQYIIDHSSSLDKVLIWAGHPGINFVTQRQSPTKYIFLLHVFSPTPSGRNGFSELMHDLDTNPPKLIVAQPISSMGLPDITGTSDPVCVGCDASILAGLAQLRQFVASRYELTYSIWDWVVYTRIH